jgi:SNF2 family DNA or RNA helicase
VIPDLRYLDAGNELLRWERADAVHDLADVSLPPLAWWNYEPCEQHEQCDPLCQRCGGTFRRHQRVGATWLWLVMKGLLGDPTGTGKTINVLGLLAMLKESGELGISHPAQRCVVVAGAAEQWRDECRRFLPGLVSVAATGTAAQRAAKYTDPWEILIISPETLRMRNIRRKSGGTTRAGDAEILEHFDIGVLIYDDVDAMRHYETGTAVAIAKLAGRARRVVGTHATPVQKRPMEVYDYLIPVGGPERFGSRAVFKHTYVKVEDDYYETRDNYGHQVVRSRKKETGIKNGEQLKLQVSPMVLRRTAAQMDDVSQPELVPSVSWVDLTPAQRSRYADLRKGVLKMIKETGEQTELAAAAAAFTYGQQICSGLATLDGEGRDPLVASAKLDWLVDKITGDFADGNDKTVIFIYFLPNLADASARLTAEGIGHVVRWGRNQDRAQRHADLERFRNDPSCRVLLGTTTIEKSLNLQGGPGGLTRHMAALDTLINPARMRQLAGRAARIGSTVPTVYFHHVLARGTQEEAYPRILQEEQALADWLWSERSDLFPALAPIDLLRMISGDPGVRAAAGRAGQFV